MLEEEELAVICCDKTPRSLLSTNENSIIHSVNKFVSDCWSWIKQNFFNYTRKNTRRIKPYVVISGIIGFKLHEASYVIQRKDFFQKCLQSRFEQTSLLFKIENTSYDRKLLSDQPYETVTTENVNTHSYFSTLEIAKETDDRGKTVVWNVKVSKNYEMLQELESCSLEQYSTAEDCAILQVGSTQTLKQPCSETAVQTCTETTEEKVQTPTTHLVDRQTSATNFHNFEPCDSYSLHSASSTDKALTMNDIFKQNFLNVILTDSSKVLADKETRYIINRIEVEDSTTTLSEVSTDDISSDERPVRCRRKNEEYRQKSDALYKGKIPILVKKRRRGSGSDIGEPNVSTDDSTGSLHDPDLEKLNKIVDEICFPLAECRTTQEKFQRLSNMSSTDVKGDDSRNKEKKKLSKFKKFCGCCSTKPVESRDSIQPRVSKEQVAKRKSKPDLRPGQSANKPKSKVEDCELALMKNDRWSRITIDVPTKKGKRNLETQDSATETDVETDEEDVDYCKARRVSFMNPKSRAAFNVTVEVDDAAATKRWNEIAVEQPRPKSSPARCDPCSERRGAPQKPSFTGLVSAQSKRKSAPSMHNLDALAENLIRTISSIEVENKLFLTREKRFPDAKSSNISVRQSNVSVRKSNSSVKDDKNPPRECSSRKSCKSFPKPDEPIKKEVPVKKSLMKIEQPAGKTSLSKEQEVKDKKVTGPEKVSEKREESQKCPSDSCSPPTGTCIVDLPDKNEKENGLKDNEKQFEVPHPEATDGGDLKSPQKSLSWVIPAKSTVEIENPIATELKSMENDACFNCMCTLLGVDYEKNKKDGKGMSTVEIKPKHSANRTKSEANCQTPGCKIQPSNRRQESTTSSFKGDHCKGETETLLDRKRNVERYDSIGTFTNENSESQLMCRSSLNFNINSSRSRIFSFYASKDQRKSWQTNVEQVKACLEFLDNEIHKLDKTIKTTLPIASQPQKQRTNSPVRKCICAADSGVVETESVPKNEDEGEVANQSSPCKMLTVAPFCLLKELPPPSPITGRPQSPQVSSLPTRNIPRVNPELYVPNIITEIQKIRKSLSYFLMTQN